LCFLNVLSEFWWLTPRKAGQNLNIFEINGGGGVLSPAENLAQQLRV